MLLALWGCSGRPSAEPPAAPAGAPAGETAAGEHKARLVSERLAQLDADFARLQQAGTFAPYSATTFRYRAPDEAAAKALEARLASEAHYPSEVRPPQGAGSSWLVVGTTTILPNERPFHETLLPVMVDMGLEYGCELQSWVVGPRVAAAPSGP